MTDPACKFDWTYDGYRQVWLYNGTGEPDERFHEMCYEIAPAIMDATSVDELSATIERVAAERGLIVRQYPGPSDGDPLANTYRAGVLRKRHRMAPRGNPRRRPSSCHDVAGARSGGRSSCC